MVSGKHLRHYLLWGLAVGIGWCAAERLFAYTVDPILKAIIGH
jgi:hypothetical protein